MATITQIGKTATSVTVSVSASYSIEKVRIFKGTYEYPVVTSGFNNITITGLTFDSTNYFKFWVYDDADSMYTEEEYKTLYTWKATYLSSVGTNNLIAGNDLSYTLYNESGSTSNIQVYLPNSQGINQLVYTYNNAPNSGIISFSSDAQSLFNVLLERGSGDYLIFKITTVDYSVYKTNTSTAFVSIVLTTPSLSNSSFEIGTTPTIYTNRTNSNITHDIDVAFGSYSASLSTGVGVSYNWSTSAAALGVGIPNSTSGTGTITVKHYYNSTFIGQNTVGFTASLAASVVPSFTSLTHIETTQRTIGGTQYYVKDYVGSYVQNLSNILFTINGAAGIYGSTIAKYEISYSGNTYLGAQRYTGAVNWVGANTITATVTDSRGRTYSSQIQVSAVAYTVPFISSFTVNRALSNGTLDELGEYAKIQIIGSAASLINGTELNNLTAKIYSKLRTDSTFVLKKTVTGALSINSTTFDLGGYSSIYSYDFKLELIDIFNTTIATLILSSGAVVMSWGQTGVGVGKVYESGALDVSGQLNLIGNISQTGTISTSGITVTNGVNAATINTTGNIVSGGAITGGTITGSSLQTSGNVTGSRLISNVATGTAPIAVSSTTVIPNLNADKIDGLDIPSITGNAAKSLMVNSSGTALEWNTATQGGTGKELVLEYTTPSNAATVNLSNLNVNTSTHKVILEYSVMTNKASAYATALYLQINSLSTNIYNGNMFEYNQYGITNTNTLNSGSLLFGKINNSNFEHGTIVFQKKLSTLTTYGIEVKGNSQALSVYGKTTQMFGYIANDPTTLNSITLTPLTGYPFRTGSNFKVYKDPI